MKRKVKVEERIFGNTYFIKYWNPIYPKNFKTQQEENRQVNYYNTVLPISKLLRG